MPFGWDSVAGRYRTNDGRLVKEEAVRRALDQAIDMQASAMRTQTQLLVDGHLSLAAWTSMMLTLIKSVHVLGASIAVGGWRQLDQAWYGWTGQRIRAQYEWLRRFSVELSSGTQKLDGTAVARAQMYAAAGRATHREAQRRLAAQRIVGEERRMLGRADHCRTCLAQAKLKWQPFGTLRRIGDSECRVNCRCWFVFRAVPAA